MWKISVSIKKTFLKEEQPEKVGCSSFRHNICIAGNSFKNHTSCHDHKNLTRDTTSALLR
jgi:hypothetical protein